MHCAGRCPLTRPSVPCSSYGTASRSLPRHSEQSAFRAVSVRYRPPKDHWKSPEVLSAIDELKSSCQRTLNKIHQNPTVYLADPCPDETLTKTKGQRKKLNPNI
jgi:hypothetical protein